MRFLAFWWWTQASQNKKKLDQWRRGSRPGSRRLPRVEHLAEHERGTGGDVGRGSYGGLGHSGTLRALFIRRESGLRFHSRFLGLDHFLGGKPMCGFLGIHLHQLAGMTLHVATDLIDDKLDPDGARPFEQARSSPGETIDASHALQTNLGGEPIAGETDGLTFGVMPVADEHRLGQNFNLREFQRIPHREENERPDGAPDRSKRKRVITWAERRSRS